VANVARRETRTLDRSTAVASVLASFRMENLEPDAETAALLARYTSGSISLAELGSAIERNVARMESQQAAEGAA